MINKQNLKKYWFTAADIEAASNGQAKEVVIRSWVQNGHFNTSLPEGERGKARKYPLDAVYEAVLLSHLSKLGVSLDAGKRAVREVLNDVEKGNDLGWIVFGSDNWTPQYTNDSQADIKFGERAIVKHIAKGRKKDIYYGAGQAIINVQDAINHADEVLVERITDRMQSLLNDSAVTGE